MPVTITNLLFSFSIEDLIGHEFNVFAKFIQTLDTWNEFGNLFDQFTRVWVYDGNKYQEFIKTLNLIFIKNHLLKNSLLENDLNSSYIKLQVNQDQIFTDGVNILKLLVAKTSDVNNILSMFDQLFFIIIKF